MSWKAKEFAYFMEMGTGKSKVLIDNISILYDYGRIDSALIVAPKGVYKNWAELEIPKHIPDHIHYDIIVWTPNPNKQEKENMVRLFESTENLVFFIIEYKFVSYSRREKVSSSCMQDSFWFSG